MSGSKEEFAKEIKFLSKIMKADTEQIILLIELLLSIYRINIEKEEK